MDAMKVYRPCFS